MKYHIYTDASYRYNADVGSYAAVILTDRGILERVCFASYTQTNSNRMEIMAIIKALETLEPNVEIVVFTDSRNAIRRLANVENNRRPENNKDLYYYYNRVVTRKNLNVEFKWVASHSGNKYNEIADSIANKASKLVTPEVDIICPKSN